MAITTVSSHVVSVNAIQGTLIADNAITAVHIATNAVSGTLIADNAVTAVHIAQNSITVTQLADDCVESDKIADGVITTNHLNKAMISSQTEVTPVAGDFVLLGDTSDSNNLKKTPISDIVALAGVAGISSSADATAITIDSSERVGIGVSSPLAPLDVVRGGTTGLSSVNARTALLVQNNLSNGTVLSINAKNTGYSGIFLGDQDNEAICQIQYVHTDDKLKFFTNGGGYNPLTLSGQNVGIGTSSPSAQLQVGSGTDALSGTGTGQICLSGAGQTLAVAGKPAVYHRNGVGLGLYSDASMSFEINGSSSKTEAMRINANGNIGIGKTASTKLDVESSGVAGQFKTTGQSVPLILKSSYGTSHPTILRMYDNDESTWWDIQHNNNDNSLAFDIGDSEKMRISSNGSIGVGTTDSTYSMSLQNIVSNDVMLQIKNTTANEDTGIFIDAVQGGAATNTRIGHSVIAGNNLLQITNPNGHAFYTGTSSLTERMRIDSSGNVGIGAASPDGKLHVYQSDASITPDADADDFIIEGNGATGMTIGSSNSSVGSIRFADSGSPRAGMVYYNHASNEMKFYTNAIERMHIDSEGLDIKGVTLYSSTSASLSTTATDFYVNSTNAIGSGIYLLKIILSGGGFYSEMYSGIMVWYSGTTNNPTANDIFLTGMGHANTVAQLNARVLRKYSNTNVHSLQLWLDSGSASSFTLSITAHKLAD